jgi:signal transduction histidine kinase
MTEPEVYGAGGFVRSNSIGRLALLLIAATSVSRSLAAMGPEASGQAHRPAILMISLDDPDQPIVRQTYEGLQAELATWPLPPTLYREFYDQVRFGDRKGYARDYIEWLHHKFRDTRLDLIIATEQQTLQLRADYEGNPWHGLPVLYGTVGHLTIDITTTHPTASGVVMENYTFLTLDAIRRVFPKVKRVAVVSGASAAIRERIAWVSEQIRSQGFEVINLGGLTMDDVRPRVSSLDPDTVPLLVQFPQDARGQRFGPGEACAAISPATNPPLFANAAFDIDSGCGALAGTVVDFAMTGRELGVQARRRLAGGLVKTVTIPMASQSRLAFDWRQVQRWAIDLSRLPPGAELRFRTPTVWELYRWYIVGASFLILIEALLISALLIQRRHRRRADLAVRATSDRNRELAHRLITTQEEERMRVARELHDDVGQRMASLSIGLSRVRRRFDPTQESVREEVSALQQQTMGLSKDLRQLSHELHPGALEHVGLVEALRARCVQLSKEANISASVDVADGWSNAPADVSLCLYRVAQEALRNVAAHARARTARVSLARQNGQVLMQVADDGQGFELNPVAERRGLGLVSMSERVRMLGGTFEVQGGSGEGTIVMVAVPDKEP